MISTKEKRIVSSSKQVSKFLITKSAQDEFRICSDVSNCLKRKKDNYYILLNIIIIVKLTADKNSLALIDMKKAACINTVDLDWTRALCSCTMWTSCMEVQHVHTQRTQNNTAKRLLRFHWTNSVKMLQRLRRLPITQWIQLATTYHHFHGCKFSNFYILQTTWIINMQNDKPIQFNIC